MRNLIIIGNGFDKAHGMKTGYDEFIKDLLNKHFNDKKSYKDIISFSSLNSSDELINIIKQHPIIHTKSSKDRPFREDSSSDRNEFQFNNKFVEYLLYANKYNWCDIEYLYFKELMLYLNYPSDLSEMHKDFDIVKKYLSDYLVSEEKKATKINSYENFFESFANLPHSQNDVLVLNFNYTRTIENLYKDVIKYPIIHIHGKLEDEKNPIIFGYAAKEDELDKLLSQNNNEFFKNIKKHLYKRTKNEEMLDNFLRSYDYEDEYGEDNLPMPPNSENEYVRLDLNIFILGHSCGLSDSLILSKIFNKEFLRSIKTFYYNSFENYFDVQVNIDRISHKGFNRLESFEGSHCMPQHNDDKSENEKFVEYLKTIHPKLYRKQNLE
jgi:hypothetical protein